MLKSIAIKNLKPNPFRRLDEYPIQRDKVDALKESIRTTGFWGTIVGRPNGEDVEVAFGHHRLVALQEIMSGEHRVEIIVRDLSNEQMLKMMASENMEKWGSSAWVELETIRSVLEAYGEGKIELPVASKDTRKDQIRHVCQSSGTGPYTQAMVAEFLGWTRKAHADGLRPNYACETAFRALDIIDAGFLEEADCKGLTRKQMAELVNCQWSLHQAENKEAKRNREDATTSKKLAEKADTPQDRYRHEKRAKVHEEQAQQHEAAAKEKTKGFAKEAAAMYRQGSGFRDVRKRAEELKPVSTERVKIHQVDDLANRIADKLEHFANGDDDMSGDIAFLKQNKDDLSDRAAKGLCQSFSALIGRLERIRAHFTVS